MICIAPGIIPDANKKYIQVPCGKCPPCIVRRAGSWYFRLKEEQKFSNNTKFVTLTYDEKNVTEELQKKDIQDFIKRLRHKTECRYYAVGEYGSENGRPHFHAIMFNLCFPYNYSDIISAKMQRSTAMEKIWQKGYVDVREVENERLRYVCGYLDKRNSEGKIQREFNLMSKGIGKGFINEKLKDYYNRNPTPYIVGPGGEKINFPRYYREKLITDSEAKARRSQQIVDWHKENEMEDRQRIEVSKDLVRRWEIRNKMKRRSVIK